MAWHALSAHQHVIHYGTAIQTKRCDTFVSRPNLAGHPSKAEKVSSQGEPRFQAAPENAVKGNRNSFGSHRELRVAIRPSSCGCHSCASRCVACGGTKHAGLPVSLQPGRAKENKNERARCELYDRRGIHQFER